MESRENRESRKKPSMKRVFIVIILVFVALLMLDLNNRLIELFNLRDQHNKLEAQVTEMVSTREFLITKQAYATSVNAVEEWAREEGHMIQTGDHPIVPIEPQDSEVIVEPFAFVTPTPVRNIDIWYELFFGD